jgi:hypothetical protein
MEPRAHRLARDEFLAHVKLIDSVPSLQAKMLSLQVRYEDILAHALARKPASTRGRPLRTPAGRAPDRGQSRRHPPLGREQRQARPA